jgi:branched-chain amino acid transport system substrate-binding protein
VPQGVADFSTILTRLRSSQPDAIALYVLGADQLTFLRQAQSFGLQIPVTGRVEFSGDHLEILTTYEGFEGSSSIFPYSHLVETEANQQFVEAFREEYGEDPIYQSFEGYQALYLFADAIERAGSTDREAIRNALEETDTESMLGGQIQFDEHNQAHDVAVILQIVDGEPIVADTVDTAP